MPIRELLLIATVATVCCAAFFRPQLGLMGYVWFALLRPDALAWVTDRYPFSMALAVATLIGSIRYFGALPSLFSNPVGRLMVLFQVPLAISVLASAGPFLAEDRYTEFVRVSLMVCLIPILFRTEKDVRQLLLVMAFSLGFLGAKYGFYGLRSGGVVFSEAYSPQYDNNTMGMAFAMIVPLCWYGRSLVSSRWTRLALGVILLGSSAGVIMTNSRGASLALGAGFLYTLMQAKKKTALVCVLLLAVGPAVYLLQDVYIDRMATIATYKEEASAASRIDYAKAAIGMWADHPLTGVGFGSRNYAALSAKYLGRENVWMHGAHNSYLQMLVDSGILAFFIYVALIFGTIRRLRRAGRELPADSAARAIPAALETALIIFGVGAIFHSFQRYDFSYMLMMTAGAWLALPRRAEAQAPVPDAEPVEAHEAA